MQTRKQLALEFFRGLNVAALAPHESQFVIERARKILPGGCPPTVAAAVALVRSYFLTFEDENVLALAATIFGVVSANHYAIFMLPDERPLLKTMTEALHEYFGRDSGRQALIALVRGSKAHQKGAWLQGPGVAECLDALALLAEHSFSVGEPDHYTLHPDDVAAFGELPPDAALARMLQRLA